MEFPYVALNREEKRGRGPLGLMTAESALRADTAWSGRALLSAARKPAEEALIEELGYLRPAGRALPRE